MIGDGPYTLPQVAKMTGLSLRSIERGCRNGTIKHLPKGEGTKRVHRVMTRTQVDALIAQRETAATPAAQPAPKHADELAEAREATRKRLARRTGHRRAA